ncbi:MAG: HEAT repeat domain-containing protein [Inquilinus sp.]|nr:HEAT repeat domain-containing protein [Inquilinus sp.]
MGLLESLWWGSLLLSGLSILIAGGLVAMRAVNVVIEGRRARRRDELTTYIVVALDADSPTPDFESRLNGRDRDLLAEVAMELFEMVKGGHLERFTALLKRTGVIDAARRRLRQGKSFQRVRAARLLGAYGDEAAADDLFLRLRDRDVNVRLAAATALADRGEVRSMWELVHSLSYAAIRSTPRLRHVFRGFAVQHADEIIALATDPIGRHLRPFLIDAIGHSGRFDALPFLIDTAMSDPDKQMRAEALAALGRLGHPDAVDAVIGGLVDSEWPVRVQAAKCAAAVGIGEAVPLVERLVEDPVWWVRHQAAESLSSFGEVGHAALERLALHNTPGALVAQRTLFEKR